MLRSSFLWRHGKDSRIFNGVYMDAVKGAGNVPAQISRKDATGASIPVLKGATQGAKLTFSGEPMPRKSGLQWEVLSLYRKLHRAAESKLDIDTRKNLRSMVRAEFKKEASLPRRNVNKIEWCMNRARTKLEDIKDLRADVKFGVVH